MKLSRLISLTIASAALLTGCGESTSEKADVQNVRLETATPSAGGGTLSYPGKTKASEEVNVAFRVSGPIERVLVKEGDKVSKGQLIAQMDQRDYKVQLEATAAEYASIKADAERVMAMYEEKSVSASDYDKARYGLRQITEKLNNHKNQLADTRLYSPISGYVKSKLHESGETVSAGMPIVTVSGGGDVEVEVNLPAADYASLSRMHGMTCTFDVLGGETFPLEVSRVSKEANTSQLYAVRLKIKGNFDRSKITPGMSTMVYATLGGADGGETVSVPSAAVLNKDGKTQVFVYDAGSGTVKLRDVTVGALHTDGTTEVSAGLSAGEKVVSAGVHHLTDGEKAKPLAPVSKSNAGGLM